MDKKGRRKVHRMLGETNPSTKLTKKQAEEIRKASGFHKDIAKKFGVSKQLVSAIKRNEIWK
jgi:transcriptional regulator with XRE-family HTH domain